MKMVIAMLGVCLLGALSWGAIGVYNNRVQQMNIATLTTAINQRDTIIQQAHQDYANLTTQYNELNGFYVQVQDYYAQSQIEVGNLQGEVANLEANVSQLKGEVADLEQENKGLGLEITSLENKYERDVAYYEQAVEDAEFSFYYVPVSQRYGVLDLEEYIKRWEWKEGAYILHKFDCSQMSAYLEWKLENEGYHTYIAVGDDPSGGSIKHAWLLVEVEDNEYIPVEATAYSIVYPWSSYHSNYFEYDTYFETIHDALRSYGQTEFRWW